MNIPRAYGRRPGRCRAGPVRSGCCPGRQGGPGSCAVDCGSYTPRPSTRGLIVAPGVFPRRSDSIDRCNISEVQLTLLPASVAIRLAGRREPHRLHRRGAAAPAGPGKSPDRRGVGHLGRGDECAACLIGVAPARASRGGPTAGGRLASLLGSHLRRAPGQRPAGRTGPAGEPGRPADGEPVRLYRSGRPPHRPARHRHSGKRIRLEGAGGGPGDPCAPVPGGQVDFDEVARLQQPRTDRRPLLVGAVDVATGAH